MPQRYPSTTDYVAAETRRAPSAAGVAYARDVRQAGQRQAGLPIGSKVAAGHHAELLAQTDIYRLTARMTGAGGMRATARRLRASCGAALVQAGTWLQGSAPVPSTIDPLPSA